MPLNYRKSGEIVFVPLCKYLLCVGQNFVEPLLHCNKLQNSDIERAVTQFLLSSKIGTLSIYTHHTYAS